MNLNADFFFPQVGLRTEGLLEAFLKNLHLTDNVDRITKMKRVIDAVRHSIPYYYCYVVMLLLMLQPLLLIIIINEDHR